MTEEYKYRGKSITQDLIDEFVEYYKKIHRLVMEKPIKKFLSKEFDLEEDQYELVWKDLSIQSKHKTTLDTED